MVMAQVNTVIVTFSYLQNKKLNKGLTADEASRLEGYWKNAGRRNLDNMLAYIKVNIVKTKTDNSTKLVTTKVPPPIIFPQQGIYHPALPNLIINDQ